MPPGRGDVWSTAQSFVSAGAAAAAHLRREAEAEAAGRKRKKGKAAPSSGLRPPAPSAHVPPPRVSHDRHDAPSSNVFDVKAAAKAAAAAARGDGTFLKGEGLLEPKQQRAAADEATQVAHSFLIFASSLLDYVDVLRDRACIAVVAAQSRVTEFLVLCSPQRAQGVKKTKAVVVSVLDELEGMLVEAECWMNVNRSILQVHDDPDAVMESTNTSTTFSDLELDENEEDARNKEFDDAIDTARSFSTKTIKKLKLHTSETAAAAATGVVAADEAVNAFQVEGTSRSLTSDTPVQNDTSNALKDTSRPTNDTSDDVVEWSLLSDTLVATLLTRMEGASDDDEDTRIPNNVIEEPYDDTMNATYEDTIDPFDSDSDLPPPKKRKKKRKEKRVESVSEDTKVVTTNPDVDILTVKFPKRRYRRHKDFQKVTPPKFKHEFGVE